VKRWPIDRVETGNKARGGEWEWHGPKAWIPRLVKMPKRVFEVKV